MDKLTKVTAEIERLIGDYNIKTEKYRGMNEQAHQYYGGKRDALSEILKSIVSMREECMYSKDNYTDEDRKALCDGCEEECIEKINEERKRDLSLWSLGDFENNFFEIIKPYKDSRNYKNLCIRLVVWRSELWRWIHWKKRKEEPVSEKFEKALAEEWQSYIDRGAATVDALEDNTQELAFAKGFYRGANWQKVKDQETIETAIHHAYHNGKLEMKEEMMAKAVDTIVKVDAGGYPYVDTTIELYDYVEDIPLAKGGDKYKVIVIKES